MLLVIVLALFLWLKPPALLRVGANYSAKIVCSNVFLAGARSQRGAASRRAGPGHFDLEAHARFRRPRARRGARRILGLHRRWPCAVSRAAEAAPCCPTASSMLRIAAGARGTQSYHPSRASADVPLWPEGTRVETKSAIDQVLQDAALAGPGARAIVVVDHGRIVGERYAAGFTATTPLLGWSMTKTVTAGVIGHAGQGRQAVPRSSRILAGQRRPRKDSLERPARHVERSAMERGLRRGLRCHRHAVPATRHGRLRALAAAGASAGRGVAVLQRHRRHSGAHRAGSARAAGPCVLHQHAALRTPRNDQRDDRAG